MSHNGDLQLRERTRFESAEILLRTCSQDRSFGEPLTVLWELPRRAVFFWGLPAAPLPSILPLKCGRVGGQSHRNLPGHPPILATEANPRVGRFVLFIC